MSETYSKLDKVLLCLLLLFVGWRCGEIINPIIEKMNNNTMTTSVEKYNLNADCSAVLVDSTLYIRAFGGLSYCDQWLFKRCDEAKVKKIVVESAKVLPANEFKGMFPNLEEIIFQEYIEEVGERALANLPNLTSVKFLGGCGRIGDYAFENCVRLKGVELPEDCEVGSDIFGAPSP